MAGSNVHDTVQQREDLGAFFCYRSGLRLRVSMAFSLKGRSLKFDSAEEILEHLAAMGVDVEEIDLSGNTFGIEACKALAKSLSSLDKLSVRYVFKDVHSLSFVDLQHARHVYRKIAIRDSTVFELFSGISS